MHGAIGEADVRELLSSVQVPVLLLHRRSCVSCDIGHARYLRDHQTIVDVFYVSNVERYLWEQGDHGKQFYANAAALPIDQSSTFIRSVTSDISRRLGVPLPDGTANWRSFLSPMSESLKAFAEGRTRSYREMFEIVR